MRSQRHRQNRHPPLVTNSSLLAKQAAESRNIVIKDICLTMLTSSLIGAAACTLGTLLCTYLTPMALNLVELSIPLFTGFFPPGAHITAEPNHIPEILSIPIAAISGAIGTPIVSCISHAIEYKPLLDQRDHTGIKEQYQKTRNEFFSDLSKGNFDNYRYPLMIGAAVGSALLHYTIGTPTNICCAVLYATMPIIGIVSLSVGVGICLVANHIYNSHSRDINPHTIEPPSIPPDATAAAPAA